MLDLKTMKSALEQLEAEKKIPQKKILEAVSQALAAAYKKEYGKKGQIIRANFNLDDGKMEFFQVKEVIDKDSVRFPEIDEGGNSVFATDEDDDRPRYNEDQHIMIDDAKIIKSGSVVGEEIIFPLENKEDFGRIAAQTAKQVIIQRIREAERESIVDEYGDREGEIVSGIVQKIERGNIYIDFNRTTGILPYDEQIPGERHSRGQRIRAFLYEVEESPRGILLKLSRVHPQFIEALFALESPEIASGVVEIKSIAREAGSRSKIAVWSNDENVDPVGSCVGQRGIRVSTVMSELGNEKIDIIEWDEDPATYIAKSLSPAKVLDLEVKNEEKIAYVEVSDDQLSLAIGKGGQNVRLAAKLTGWKIDISGVHGETAASSDGDTVKVETDEKVVAEEKTNGQKDIDEKDVLENETASEELN